MDCSISGKVIYLSSELYQAGMLEIENETSSSPHGGGGVLTFILYVYRYETSISLVAKK